MKVESGNTKYDSRDNCNAIIETASNSLVIGCKNTIIPNSVTIIGKSAFYRCSDLTSITIPNSVTSIGEWAFYNCSGLTSVTIPNSVTSIGNSAFYRCSGLTSITIPNGVTSIGYDTFHGCTGLTSITIPNGVTSIGFYAFRDCTGLTSITIGNSITNIDYCVFYGCSRLQNVYCYAEQLPTTGYNVFGDVNTGNATLHVLANSLSLYESTAPWSDFGSIVPLTDDDPKPTGVDMVYGLGVKVNRYFDLNGRKLTDEPTQKGVYITSGRKVVIK